MPHDTPPKTNTPITQPAPSRQVAFDWRDWLPYLADADIPDTQKRVLIEALWSVVLSFVDLGFEVTSPTDICGEAFDLKAALEAAVLNSKKTEGDAA